MQCSACKTGPSDCDINYCSFDGGWDSLMITDPEIEVDLTIPFIGECQLRVLAIGGGGKTTAMSPGHTDVSCGGGGSGYIRYIDMRINGSSTINVKVGASESSSVVKINGDTMIANAGRSDQDVIFGGVSFHINHKSCLRDHRFFSFFRIVLVWVEMGILVVEEEVNTMVVQMEEMERGDKMDQEDQEVMVLGRMLHHFNLNILC